jgi:hypothetical protein
MIKSILFTLSFFLVTQVSVSQSLISTETIYARRCDFKIAKTITTRVMPSAYDFRFKNLNPSFNVVGSEVSFSNEKYIPNFPSDNETINGNYSVEAVLNLNEISVQAGRIKFPSVSINIQDNASDLCYVEGSAKLTSYTQQNINNKTSTFSINESIPIKIGGVPSFSYFK